MAKNSRSQKGNVDVPEDEIDTKNNATENNTSTLSSSVPQVARKFNKDKREMAWLALISCIFVMFCAMFFVDPERLKVLSDVFTWFYFCMVSIVGSYFGFSVMYDIKKK